MSGKIRSRLKDSRGSLCHNHTDSDSSAIKDIGKLISDRGLLSGEFDVITVHRVSQPSSKDTLPCAERTVKREGGEDERNYFLLRLRDILIK